MVAILLASRRTPTDYFRCAGLPTERRALNVDGNRSSEKTYLTRDFSLMPNSDTSRQRLPSLTLHVV